MIIRYVAFKGGKQTAEGTGSIVEAANLRGPNDFVWLSLAGVDQQEMATVAREFGLHELAVEDADHAHQRPKIEEYGDSLFIVLRNAHYDQKTHQLELGEIHLFLGDDYVIGVRHGGDVADLDQIAARVAGRPDLLRFGSSAVVYAAMDQVVDDYGPVVAELSTDIAGVETEVFDGNSVKAVSATTEDIYTLKREVIEMHTGTAPLVFGLQRLQEGLFPHIPDEIRPYFRDVLDHLQRVIDQIDSFRELLTSVLSANVALVSVRQNEIVQKISGWAAIIAVPTLISGIYGMNFEHMPELRTYWGYPAALALMAILSFGLYRLLRRIHWL